MKRLHLRRISWFIDFVCLIGTLCISSNATWTHTRKEDVYVEEPPRLINRSIDQSVGNPSYVHRKKNQNGEKGKRTCPSTNRENDQKEKMPMVCKTGRRQESHAVVSRFSFVFAGCCVMSCSSPLPLFPLASHAVVVRCLRNRPGAHQR